MGRSERRDRRTSNRDELEHPARRLLDALDPSPERVVELQRPEVDIGRGARMMGEGQHEERVTGGLVGDGPGQTCIVGGP